MVHMFNDIIVLARPYQYVKNIFVFFPVFFSLQLNQPVLFARACIAFCGFCLVSSAVYILNDWRDRFADALHPKKCHRPIASGKVGTIQALCAFVLFLTLGLFVAAKISYSVLFLMLVYLILNVAYSFKLKHLPVLDLLIVCIFFVLRLFVGAAATNVVLSYWIIGMTFLLAMFLTLAKRRDDIVVYLNSNRKVRNIVDKYSLNFIEIAMQISGFLIILVYFLWSSSQDVMTRYSNKHIYLTSIFVMIGVLRYMYVSFRCGGGWCPVQLLFEDKIIQFVLVCWVGVFILILYFNNFVYNFLI